MNVKMDLMTDCVNNNGGVECETHKGYRGNGKIVLDIDECMDGSDDCDVNADCQNTNGSYKCACDHGFFGYGRTCSDINGCFSGNNDCDKNASCLGGYECVCNKGFEGDGQSCFDVDEYFMDIPCDVDATCMKSIGSYSCKFNTG